MHYVQATYNPSTVDLPGRQYQHHIIQWSYIMYYDGGETTQASSFSLWVSPVDHSRKESFRAINPTAAPMRTLYLFTALPFSRDYVQVDFVVQRRWQGTEGGRLLAHDLTNQWLKTKASSLHSTTRWRLRLLTKGDKDYYFTRTIWLRAICE